MIDPLAEVVSLLQPNATASKVVSGAGSWRIRRSEVGRAFYCVFLKGSCCLVAEGHEPITLQVGDFVLIPSAHNFTLSSVDAVMLEDFETIPVELPNGEFRVGIQSGPPDVQSLVGYCVLGSPDADLLVSLLPNLVHVRGEKRLSTIVQLVVDESLAQRPGRDVVLARLLEVLLIEAFRSATGKPESQGLVRGLADERLATAIRRMHENPAGGWTVEQLAKEAALSRSAFYDRFNRALGLAPMEYLFVLRMAIAKKMLRSNEGGSMADVADRIGYGSASAFSVAFTRHVGMSPSRYARSREDKHRQ
jgi:AraC-like DNA-binding protein